MARKFLLFGAVVPCWCLAFLVLVPRSQPLRQLAADTGLLATRAYYFPRAAWERDRNCRLGEAWNHAIEPETAAMEADLLRACTKTASDGGMDLIQTPSGPFWLPARDFLVLGATLAEQHRDIYGVESGGVRPGDIVLDCGANIGVYTRHALRAGAATVVAIEPGPESLACLRRNFATEIRAGKVIVFPKGVWDKDEEMALTAGASVASTAANVALDRRESGPRIKLTTIDEMVAELKLPRVDSIKMDIEGAETRALIGGRRTIATYRPRMAISLEHGRNDPRKISELIRRLWPDRQVECGPCRNIERHVRPEVAFVR